MTATEPTPTAEHIDAVAFVIESAWSDGDDATIAHAILTSTDPAVHEALAANLPADVMLAALVRAGMLTEEWAVQYECDLSTPRMSGETERTITTQVPSEDRARQAVKNHAPINARNRRMARRLATEWEVAP